MKQLFLQIDGQCRVVTLERKKTLEVCSTLTPAFCLETLSKLQLDHRTFTGQKHRGWNLSLVRQLWVASQGLEEEGDG